MQIKNPFRKKKKKINTISCELCKNSLVVTDITENNINYILENIDYSNIPNFLMKSKDRDKLLVMFFTRSYILFMCNSCNFFKLVKAKDL